jgi:hypothetical protein
MNEEKPLDMLQIKIDRARESLPKETVKAIDSVDWRAVILGMREKKGYSYEQLEDLELETELLLCGLLNPADYPKELEERLKLPKPQIDLLVNEMNEFVFKKIKDELIKTSERREIFVKTPTVENIEVPIVDTLRKDIEKEKIPPALNNKTDLEVMPIEIPPTNTSKTSGEEKGKGSVETIEKSISNQKLSGSFQIPTTKTEYSLPSLGKDKTNPMSSRIIPSKEDPYREMPE